MVVQKEDFPAKRKIPKTVKFLETNATSNHDMWFQRAKCKDHGYAISSCPSDGFVIGELFILHYGMYPTFGNTCRAAPVLQRVTVWSPAMGVLEYSKRTIDWCLVLRHMYRPAWLRTTSVTCVTVRTLTAWLDALGLQV